MTNDATDRALALVATLPPAQAEMVMLRVVAGLDVADVAEMVDKKPGHGARHRAPGPSDTGARPARRHEQQTARGGVT